MKLNKLHYLATAALFCGSVNILSAQYWQQEADYTIATALDTDTHQYMGTERVEYTNNSPDTLTQFYFHLYPNAFQPGSMMDVRSQTILDADPRVGSRIGQLTPEQQGYLHIDLLTQDGTPVIVKEEETVAVVILAEPILPGEEVEFEMRFSGQVPEQVRRSGRNNAEGVDYSMSQWYPKVVEYDYMGWHANPYVGREFHGVWGDFDVTVALPADQVFAGTGYMRDVDDDFADDFERRDKRRLERAIKKGDYIAHRRVAPNVHDFTWAADPAYRRVERKRADGTLLEFYFIPSELTTENWEQLPAIMDAALVFINANYGQYPYEKYAIIQGGDGGMEYAMCTLITGERSLQSLVGVSVHELMHSWYQFILASNESLYPWMDEGFTSYASAEVMNYLASTGALPGAEVADNPHEGTIMGYARFTNSGRSEPISTHADHYTTNAAYGVGSYVKGQLFLYQLRAIIGDEAFDRGMKRYFQEWKFKHPTPNDFIRVMEKTSGQELDWYLQYMVNTTHQIDYAIDSVYQAGANKSVVRLRKVGGMPFPLDLALEDSNGEAVVYHIPTVLQRGHAPLEGRRLAADWPWTNPTYELELPIPLERISRLRIDPKLRMSEADKMNNDYPRISDSEN